MADRAHDGNGGGRIAVLVALAANAGITVAKFVAFLVTGSASMLAETVHSLADSGNQALLLLGGHLARRPADDEHPFGYSTERYFWSFVVAVLLFSLGSLFALLEAEEKLRNPRPVDSVLVPMIVVGTSALFEGFSLLNAVRQAGRVRGRRSWGRFIRSTKDAELPVVLLEDSAALIGLSLAASGILLSWFTGNGVFDGLGSLGIGILLGVIALVLAREMKSLLIGESAGPQTRAALEEALSSTPGVSELADMRTLQLGPDQLLVTASVRLDPSLDGRAAVEAVAEARRRAQDITPFATTIYVTPV